MKYPLEEAANKRDHITLCASGNSITIRFDIHPLYIKSSVVRFSLTLPGSWSLRTGIKQHLITLLNLSQRTNWRPLLRSLAKTIYRSSVWSCGDIGVDRVVIKRHITSKRTHYWWPRRKDEEDEVGRNTAFNRENVDSVDDSRTQDMSLHSFLSRKHEASKEIHILGAGNLGAFVAHSLAGIPKRPPITLLLRPRQLRMWEDYDCSIEIITNGVKETRRGFEAEAVRRLSEDSFIPDKDRSGKADGLSNQTEIGHNECSQPSYSNSKTGDGLDFNAPSLEENNLVAEDSVQCDRLGDGIPLEASISEADEPSTLQTEIDACFAHDEQEVGQAQHKENYTMTSEQIRSSDDQEGIIYHLIVSVKAPQTVWAIQAVAHRLTHDSSILFLQNGMGVLDEVNQKIFPDEKSRPTYMVGVVSHGLYSKRPFSVVHAGEGTIALGVLPRTPMDESIQSESLNQLSTSARYLMRTMTRTAVFVAVGFPPTDLLQQQLDKLAVNCIINPLTTILDCKNGALLHNFYFRRVIRLLLAEISLVIKSLPELKNVPNVKMRFDTLRLERLVASIAYTTAENYSSMVQDNRSGRVTEIDYINGYIVKRGENLGIHCAMNYMLMHMVKAKSKYTSQERADLLPLASQGSG